MENLLIKYFEGEMSSSERIAFLKKVKADAELKKEFIRLRNTYSLIRLMPDKDDPANGEVGFNRFMHQRKQKRVRIVLYKTLAYAASIALLVGVVWSIAFRVGHNSIEPVVAQIHEIQVPAGQRTKLTLGDGTIVWLNSKSKLTYPAHFTDNERNVQLSGEAYFEVAANPQKPFTVTVEDMKVTALGTAFNVLGFPETGQVQVALFEGSVRLTSQSGQETLLNPNQLAFCQNGKTEVVPIQYLEYYLWKDGIYAFVNEPLIDIMRKLELYYDVSINVTDTSISKYKYTGKFRQLDGVETILSVLQKSYPFRIEKKNNSNYILKK